MEAARVGRRAPVGTTRVQRLSEGVLGVRGQVGHCADEDLRDGAQGKGKPGSRGARVWPGGGSGDCLQMGGRTPIPSEQGGRGGRRCWEGRPPGQTQQPGPTEEGCFRVHEAPAASCW